MIDFGPMNNAVLRTFKEPETVTIGGVSVDAIFDSRHYEMEMGEAGGSSLVTTIAISNADAAGIAIGETAIVVRGENYVAKDLRPDSEGITVVEMERAP
jgi:hypothetical protein